MAIPPSTKLLGILAMHVMKRIMSFLMIGLLLISSVSLVLAEDNQENSKTPTALGGATKVVPKRVQAVTPQKLSIQNNGQTEYPNLIPTRIIPKEAIQVTHAKITELSQKETNIKEKLTISKATLTKAKNTERAEKITAAKEYLKNAIEAIRVKLENLKYQTYSNEFISDEEAEAITKKVEERLTSLAALEIKVDTFSETTSKEEILNTAKKIKEIWLDSKKDINSNLIRTANFKIENLLSKLSLVAKQIEQVVTELEEEGKDTDEIKKHLNSFKNNLETAKEQLEISKEFRENKNYEQARKAYKEAVDSLRKAKDNLKDLLQEIRKYLIFTNFGVKEAIEEAKVKANVPTAKVLPPTVSIGGKKVSPKSVKPLTGGFRPNSNPAE